MRTLDHEKLDVYQAAFQDDIVIIAIMSTKSRGTSTSTSRKSRTIKVEAPL